ncbi:uncharacterized protein LOC130014981 [Mercurialis annua]|uniref:uncharacterized protein LOC130014981 n=1 Tax=Mercurialis annua TaxID=3986 RepID=UPI0024AEDEFF|nr:uncharacterized protein LOC130014981 [Mercurialis annua]
MERWIRVEFILDREGRRNCPVAFSKDFVGGLIATCCFLLSSFVPSIGASGGLLCIWNSNFISPSRIVKANRCISMDFIWGSLNIRFILVYASNCPKERASLWDDNIAELCSDFTCILVGDFNEILDYSERLNCTALSSSMLEFSAFVSASNLIEATLQGRFFTWQNNTVRSKIDICFLSSSALCSCPNYILKALPKSYSNHVPILFSSEAAKCELGDKIEGAAEIDKYISTLEAATDLSNLSDADASRLGDLRSEFDHLSKHLESLWHKKSRLNWNLNGDRNTKYFHTVASIYSRSNMISEFLIDGVCYTSLADIKQRVHSFYKNLFQRNSRVNFSLEDLPIKLFSDIQAALLSFPFSEEEIFSTLISCDDNKAPGRMGASDIKDFRPINLINGVFKIITKALANTLSLVLPLVISENQFGFIKGRSTYDCHMIASEIIHLIKRCKEKVFLFKLDFRKAFDTISWQFILQMLQRMNFDSKWIIWISACFESAQLYVLLNGFPSDNFFMENGVRQGDPISPMLFVLAVESLIAIFAKACALGLFLAFE